MTKIALILGITGQDGAYLAKYLLNLKYKIFGTSRDSQICDTSRLESLDILNDITILSLALNDFRSVLKVITNVNPDEIYNLSGQTSVSLSFEQPIEAMESIANGTLNLLEVIRCFNKNIRFFNAGSSESFGNTKEFAANEETKLRPRSPYAVAKSTAAWHVSTYRESYNLFACTGFLSNHESILRHDRFVTKKIINGVKKIKNGKLDKLKIGNIDIYRDWGWAPKYVEAMYLMLQNKYPEDYIIATGKTTSLRYFVQKSFEIANLKTEKYLEISDVFKRPSDLEYSSLNPKKIFQELNWECTLSVDQIIEKMYNDNLY
mgnify:CR=1 FL=1